MTFPLKMVSRLETSSFVLTDRVSTTNTLNACSFGGERHRGTWKRAPVEVLDVFDLMENHEEVLELFLQEMKNMNSIRHPNIAQVFGVCLGYEQCTTMIVSEILTLTLKDSLSCGRLTTLSDRVNVLYGVLNGLRFLHENTPPIIHGLLTTDSVWISRDLCQVKITHICTARLLIEKSKPCCFQSVQHYLAPEVIEDRSNLSTSSDIFSFGILMLETLPGESGHTSLPAAEESTSFSHKQSLFSAISECQRSARERPTAKEIMSCFPSASADDTKITATLDSKEEFDHCSSSDNEEVSESSGSTSPSALVRNDMEALEQKIRDLEAHIKTLMDDKAMLTVDKDLEMPDQTVAETSEVVPSCQLDTSSLQEENHRLVQSLQDIKGFSRLKEISVRYQMSSAQPNEWSNILDVSSIPKWHYRPDVPFPCETVVAVFDGKVLIGHRGKNEMYITDSASGELLKTAIYPDSDASFDGLFISDGKIYAALVNEVTWQLSVHTYSLTENTWKLICKRPSEIELGAITFTVVGDRIFTAGGFTKGGERVDTIFMFNTTADEWQVLPNMPTARSGCSSFIYNGCICYAAGTTNERIKSKAVELLSLENYEWTSFPSTTTVGGAVTMINGTLVCTGGVEESGTASRRVEIWDSHRGSWLPLPILSQGRYFHEMAVDIDQDHTRIIVAGGYDKNNHKTSTVEVIEI
ncbi:uncharacterized protein LOC134193205 [Corticium candelabrum]|uniref:uncharacterized protein LOC134193205 n=1 Tax=Corticium candelabrum TaxID=121492 RepID=UPI002E25AB7E|nr:uncharacterized protein LOC134193205 [Corticium candelabrum]